MTHRIDGDGGFGNVLPSPSGRVRSYAVSMGWLLGNNAARARRAGPFRASTDDVIATVEKCPGSPVSSGEWPRRHLGPFTDLGRQSWCLRISVCHRPAARQQQARHKRSGVPQKQLHPLTVPEVTPRANGLQLRFGVDPSSRSADRQRPPLIVGEKPRSTHFPRTKHKLQRVHRDRTSRIREFPTRVRRLQAEAAWGGVRGGVSAAGTGTEPRLDAQRAQPRSPI